MSRWRGSVLVALLVGAILAPSLARADAEQCSAAKIRAAAKKAASKLACYRRAILTGAPLDSVCIARAEFRFRRAFAAADRNVDCPSQFDADQVEAIVDQFVSDLLAQVAPSSTTSTSTTSSSSTPSTIGCGTYPSCGFGPCGGQGEFCQAVPQCVCGGQIFCVCAATTFTTCTMPTLCSTTTTVGSTTTTVP